MSTRIRGITIEIGGETTQLGKALAEVNSDSRALQKELRGVESLLKFDPTNTVLLAQKQDILTQSIDNTKKKLDILKSTQEQVQAQFDRGEITEQQYRDFQREIVATEQQLGKLETQAESMGDELKDSTDKGSDGAQKMGGFFESALKKMDAQILMDIGDKIGDLGEKLISFGKDALDAFSDVDDGLDIIVVKTGATVEQMEEFEAINRKLVGSMPIEEISKVGEAIGELSVQFGFSGEAMEENSKIAVQFSEIHGTDVTSSVQKAKQAVSAYGMEYEDFGTVLDTVTAVSQKTGVSVEDLLQKTIDGAPQLKQMGLTFEESAFMMGEFEKAGVDSNAMLMALNKASLTYAKDGKTLSEGLSETVDAIANATDSTEALTLAQETFGIRGANKMVDAINRGEFSLNDMGIAMDGIAGKTATTYEDTLDPIDEMTVAQNNLTLAMADMGGVIAETLAPIMIVLGELISGFAEWFNGLNPIVKDFVVILGAVVAIIGILIPVIVAITVAVNVLNVALSPYILLVAGIILAIVALIVIIKNWGAIVDWFKNLWQTFSTWIVDLWNKIKTGAVTIFENIKTAISDKIQQAIDFVTGYFTRMYDKVKNTLDTVKTFVSNIFTNIKDGMTNLVTNAIDGVVTKFTSLIDKAKTIFNDVKTKITDALDIDLFAIGGDIIQGLVDGITGAVSWVTDAIGNIGNAIMDKITGFFSIFSPSRLMRDKVGKMLPQGIAVGIEADTDEAVKAVDSMNKDIMMANKDAEYLDTINGKVIKLPPPPETDGNGGGTSGGGFETFVTGLANKLDELGDRMSALKVVMDTGATVGALAPAMDEELGNISDLAERGTR